ncbi:MAG TPA: DUF4399 domain-containing protein [Chitinophagaceae bacterium]|jgi:hypothetical protein|nr:DUF4399 domain-containing protein [Chitinophagaceae bacterium]
MTNKLFFTAACFLVLSACNNSGKGSGNGNDTTNKMMSDTSHAMSMNTSNVPEVPTVPEGAKVYFKNLKDGANINSTFQVQMGVDNMKVDTVGPVLAGSGHFHIFIDAEDSLPLGTVVPKDSTHLHYGKGQTEAELTLAPGKHKLTLQFADGIHRSYGGKLATTVNVTVKK